MCFHEKPYKFRENVRLNPNVGGSFTSKLNALDPPKHAPQCFSLNCNLAFHSLCHCLVRDSAGQVLKHSHGEDFQLPFKIPVVHLIIRSLPEGGLLRFVHVLFLVLFFFLFSPIKFNTTKFRIPLLFRSHKIASDIAQ